MTDPAAPTNAIAAVWHPGDDQSRLTGTFSWEDDDGGIARLAGDLEQWPEGEFWPEMSVKHHDLLHASLNGQHYTLVDCRETNSLTSADEYLPVSNVRCRSLVEGLLDSRDVVFGAVKFRLDDGDLWVGRHGIERTHLWKPVTSAQIQFTAAEDDIAGSWSISDGLATSTDVAPQSVRLQRLSTFTYRPPEGLTLDAALDAVYAIEVLASLCCGRRISANTLRLEHATETWGTTAAGDPSPVFFSVFHRRWNHNGSPSKQGGDEPPPVTLAGLGGAQVLGRWMERHADIRSIASMVLADQQNELRYLEQRYLNNALGAELLDRHENAKTDEGDVRSDPGQFDELVNQAIAGVGDDHRDELERILQFANTPPLHQRLQRLARNIDPDRKSMFAEVKHGTWAQVAAAVRNGFTHQDGLASGDRFIHLHWLNESLRWVVLTNLVAPLHPTAAETFLNSFNASGVAEEIGASVVALSEHFGL
tara:strand:+ start:294 stop:1727 length:1434 start_codon:yes stop_codon:yes gene_type:complete